MTFLSILLSFSPDQMRLSEDFGDYIAYDQAILFNEYITPDTFAVSFELKAKESLPVIKDSFPNFDEETTIGKFLIIDSGFYSFFLTKVAQFFIELFTIKNYSGTNLATLIGLVTLGFLFNFCISIRIEVSKIRLTFLSFISIIFTFFILLTALQILNGVAPLAVFNSKNDTFVLTAFATNVAKMVVEPGSFLVGPSDDVEAIQKNLFSDPNALNLYNNSSFRKLTNDIVKLENDVYVKGEYHKSSSLFNKYQIHSSFFETNSLINNGYKIITVKDMALDIMNTVYALVGTNNIDPSRPGDFLDHTPLRHYQSMRGSHFFILSSCFCLFFLLLLFIGFSDQQFLNQNKNFEFIWLLWLFIISSLLLLMTGFDLIEIFIALECLSFCSYILISLERSKKLSSISGIRYLIISALPSALLILGIIFLYKQNVCFNLNFIESLNTVDFLVNRDVFENTLFETKPSFWKFEEQKIDNYEKFQILSDVINQNYNIFNTNNNQFLTQFYNFNVVYFYSLILISIFFIISNLSFKLSAAPFHFWAPVIYNNGLLSSVIFLNILLKLVIFLFLIMFAEIINNLLQHEIKNLFLFFALMSFFFGAGGAINERFIKRFLVYSSMVDVGFILLVFSFYDLNKVKNILLYLLVYNLSSMIIWFFLLVVRKHTKFLTNLSNVLNNNNLMKFIFSFVIFSMAGIPPFAGFFIKYNILKDIVNSENMWLSFIVLLFTILSLFYYLRLIKIVMFDNINNTKSSNLKNNNFKYILFALLLNFVIFFLIFVQESFLIIFDQLSYYLFVDVRDLASYVFTIFVDGTMKNFLFDTFKDYYINLDSYLGSEHYIKQSKLRKIAIGFMKNKVNPNFEILN